MTAVPETYVFDTGPLRHFTLKGWLGVLKFLTAGHAVIPESVEQEIRDQQYQHPDLRQILDAEWIVVDRSEDLEFLCLLYTSPSPRDVEESRMPSSA